MNDAPGGHPFAAYDAAYLLGALSAEDRAAYVAHLQTCPTCRRSVAELAGLPGLLGRVPPEVALALAGPDADGVDDRAATASAAAVDVPPPSLLPAVLDRARRERRRRRLTTAAVLGAVAAAAVALVVAVSVAVRTDPAPVTATGPVVVETVQLAPLRSSPLAVAAELRSVAWGTRIDLTCTYDAAAADGAPYGPGPVYSLVLRDAEGGWEQVGTWRAVPGRRITVEAATALPATSITRIEVRSADGTPLLRGDV